MTMTKNDPRGILKELIARDLIGPANDTFVGNGDNELINDYPLYKYFSGIVFPNIDRLDPVVPEETDYTYDSLVEDEVPIDKTEPNWDNQTSSQETSVGDSDTINDDFSRSELFPYSFGLSFCIKKDAPLFTVHIRFGRYRQVDPTTELHSGYRVKIQEEDYELIKPLNSGNGRYLNGILGYNRDTGCVFLKRKLVGTSVGEASGDFADMREIKRVVFQRLNEAIGSEKDRYSKLTTVLRNITPLYKKAWAREQYSYAKEIQTDILASEKKISYSLGKEDDTGFEYTLHILLIDQNAEYKVVKVLVENSSSCMQQGSGMRNSPALNRICMFQSNIWIESDYLQPLPQPPSPSYATIEDKTIDCQYRNSHVYALAHNCSCSWQCHKDSTITITTDYLPSVVPPVTVNSKTADISTTLNIMNNSSYGNLSDPEIVLNLNKFADAYHFWIQDQEALSDTLEDRHIEAATQIVADQNEILLRMRKGIEIIKLNPELMKLYKLSNSAMLVNMARTQSSYLPEDINKAAGINYHPFQLAFLLINIECVIDAESFRRKDSIDLLWFPTGGGKTEAYFLLSVFSMLFRRTNFGESGYGTSVIMRYTLRLLTAQQFERAARMILSLNYVCSVFMPSLIGKRQFSIGLWIGTASSPNKLCEGDNSAYDIIEKIIDSQNKEEALRVNKFPISDCPWCGHSLIEFGKTGFNCLKNKFEIRCLNPDCHFHRGLPIDLVDESLYQNPPSLLFATIDKFARLAWVDESAAFFGSEFGYLPPDLIIQDELHLISGPLGSITALFEGVIEMLCLRGGNTPRIIASTATIKNASAQVKGLFGNRSVVTFPPPGINYVDNFFAKVDSNDLNREYIGVYPTGKTFTTTQIKLLALLLYGRWELKGNIEGSIDDYWTLVSYYNSLRELGRMYSKLPDEIQTAYSQLVLKRYPQGKKYWLGRPKELTSRISGYEIKNVLHTLEAVNIDENDFDGSVRRAIDVVFATNMISVGLDIERLNVILLNGQPKGISEYIQVTSRIARKHPGLVLSLFNPFKVRDKSHYENFSAFHNNYYRFVEPISVTPYTRVAIRKLMPTMLTAYLRLVKGIKMPIQINDKDLDEFKSFMADRMNNDEMHRFLLAKVKDHMDFLREKLSQAPELTFKDLLVPASDAATLDYVHGDWLTMNSMREISPNTVIKLTTPKTRKRNSEYE